MKNCTHFDQQEYKTIIDFLYDVDDWLEWISGTSEYGPDLTTEVAKTRVGISQVHDLIKQRVDPSVHLKFYSDFKRSIASPFHKPDIDFIA